MKPGTHALHDDHSPMRLMIAIEALWPPSSCQDDHTKSKVEVRSAQMSYSPSLPQITNRYADSHADPKGAGDARPTALQIVQDEGLVGKLTDKVALVTGGTNGLGLEAVRALANTGMTVFFTSRDVAKGEKVKAQLLSEDGNAKLEVVELKLQSLASVRNGVEAVLAKTQRLDVFVPNAGTQLFLL